MNETPEHDQETELDADIGEAETGEIPEDGLDPIDALIAERDQWKDRALRAVAEAENTRRRAEQQNNDARAYAIQKFARDLLGVADTLERALAADLGGSEDPAVANLVKGLELTHKSLMQAFEANNLKRVAPEAGEAFDPHLHQAMMEQPSETVEGGKVVQTLQPGYALFGRTVRAAMVVVAARGSGPTPTAADQAAGAAAYAAAADKG